MYEKLKPKGITQEQFEKLIEGWSLGMRDREALFYAIPDMSYRMPDLQKAYAENPDLFDLSDGLRGRQGHVARKVVSDALDDGDRPTARWYLEKTKPQEFSSKAQVAIEQPIVVSVEEKEAEMKAFLESLSEE